MTLLTSTPESRQAAEDAVTEAKEMLAAITARWPDIREVYVSSVKIREENNFGCSVRKMLSS